MLRIERPLLMDMKTSLLDVSKAAPCRLIHHWMADPNSSSTGSFKIGAALASDRAKLDELAGLLNSKCHGL